MTQEFTTALKSEMKHIDYELARLRERRRQIELLLADSAPVKRAAQPKAPAPAKAPKAKATKKPQSKGWPKGMPRDKVKRVAWFKTDAGALYLRNAGFDTEGQYWAAQPGAK